MIWVFGHTGAIGHAYAEQGLAHEHEVIGFARSTSAANITQQFSFDLLDEQALAAHIKQAITFGLPDQIFIATGLLHQEALQPEKTFKTLNTTNLQTLFLINTILPSLIIKHCLINIPRKHMLKIGVLSARVGSISDNKMGGWYGYRSSKAALNMMIKNYAIELNNKYPNIIICGIQPGTTDSKLSKPFQKHLAEGQLQTAEYSAQMIWQQLTSATDDFHGQLIDFEGNIITP